MRIWLDDIRPMPAGFDVHVKTAWDAIALLKKGNVKIISLDHDLGEVDEKGTVTGNGYDVVKWIEEEVYVRGFDPPDVIKIHSANTVGRQNMEAGIASIHRRSRR